KGLVLPFKLLINPVEAVSDVLNFELRNAYDKIAQQQGKIIRQSKNEAATIEALVSEYEALMGRTSLNINEKERLKEINGQLLALAGEEAIVFDASSEAIGLNNEVIQNAIRIRRMLANTEIAAMIEDTENINKELQALNAQIQMARSGGTDKSLELAVQLEQEREKLLQKQNAVKKELVALGIDETEQAQALLAVQMQRLEKETQILQSKREALREQIAEAEEAAKLTLLEREQAKVSLIQNSNLQKAQESALKQQELAIKLDAERRKLKKELEEVILNTANAERQQVQLNARF
ncbi:MAG: hypothetical protein RMJ44_12445, partial [Cytophagales bacterium]|nr:hypothetical protein [Cytophagales bacterium]